MNDPQLSRLFISYAHVDEVRISEFAEIFRAGGFDPWWDDRLRPGDDWKGELRSQIAACDAFVYMLSNDSVESEWCKWELDQASNLEKPIIPILLRAETNLPPNLSRLQYLDASASLQSVGVAKLIGRLSRLKQTYASDELEIHNPEGLPARFKRPLPKDYRTIAQAYLQPLTSHMRLFEWQRDIARATSSGPIVGIDFGTTLSSVAIHRDGTTVLIPNSIGETTTPSAVAIGSDGTPLVGEPALRFILERPDRGVLEVKRLFGQEFVKEFGGQPVLEVDGIAYTPVNLASFVLRQLRRDAEVYVDAAVQRAVIAAPAFFDQSQYADLMAAAGLAGFDVMRVLPEPVAACVGSSVRGHDENTWLVYDLGGGTFDVSVVESGDGIFEVKSVSGDTHLGGAEFDKAIVEYCVDRFAQETGFNLRTDASALLRLREAAEGAKIALSSASAVSINVPFIASTRSRVLHLEVELTRTRLNELTHNLVSRTLDLSRAALADSGTSADNIGRVLVVGRAGRAASVKLALSDLFDNRLAVVPDHVVSLGAANQAAILAGDLRDNLLLDSTARTVRLQLRGGRSAPIIVRNTTIPLLTRTLINRDTTRTTLIMRLVSGESSKIRDTLFLKEMRIDLSNSSGHLPKVELVLSIDANSHLGISVQDLEGNVLGNASVGLRQDAKWKPYEIGPVSPNDETSLPISLDLPHVASLPSQLDRISAERWLFQVIKDLIKKAGYTWDKEANDWLRSHPSARLPARYGYYQILSMFPLERELVIDALETHVEDDLSSLRTCDSIVCLVEKLMALRIVAED